MGGAEKVRIRKTGLRAAVPARSLGKGRSARTKSFTQEEERSDGRRYLTRPRETSSTVRLITTPVRGCEDR